MKSYQLKSHVVCLFFPNPFTALLGPVHRWGMVLMDGFLFSFHTSASISFPSQTPTATTFSLSHPDHSRTIQPLSHFPTDFLPTAALIPSSASEQPKWLQKAEMTCWALLSSHHLHKKVTYSQVNPLSDVFSPVVQQEYWLAALC